MNKLDPKLKQLLVAARRAEQTKVVELSSAPPPGLADRVLRRDGSAPCGSTTTLWELMSLRAAGLSAALGLVMLTIQFSGDGLAFGALKQALPQGAALFQVFLP